MNIAYPLKTKHKENRSCAILPPVSADSIPAITRLVKVDVKSKKHRMYRNIKAPRSVTAPVGSAFW